MAKPIRWAAAFDSHGDQFDPPTMKAFWDFLSMWKPTIRIAGGDHFDFRHLRSKAGEGERYESGQHDFQCGLDFLRKFKPSHVAWGNHDDRVWQLLSSPNANVRDQAEKIIEEMEDAVKTARVVNLYRTDGVIDIGNLAIGHGWGSGIGTARRLAAIYDRILVGHLHRVEVVTVPGRKRKEAYVCGSLCKLRMPYNTNHLAALAHENGWAYGEVLPSGHTTVYLARRVGQIWHLPTEFRSISDK